MEAFFVGKILIVSPFFITDPRKISHKNKLDSFIYKDRELYLSIILDKQAIFVT